MKIKPLADRVLVLPAPAEEKVGGIIIPDTAQENLWCSKRMTPCSMANTVAQSSRSMVRSIS